MVRLVLLSTSVIVLLLFVKTSSGQDEQQAKEELQSFFENYSKWQKQKREAGDDPDGNATLSLNWGYRQEEMTYWASNEKTDFYTGFIRCKQLGMEPISIMTPEQNAQVKKFLDTQPRSDDAYAGFWIHAQKIGDRFYWLNNGKYLEYSDWYPNYPDNVGGNENCVTLLFHGGLGVAWNDVECGRSDIRYACQKRRSSIAFILDINRGIY